MAVAAPLGRRQGQSSPVEGRGAGREAATEEEEEGREEAEEEADGWQIAGCGGPLWRRASRTGRAGTAGSVRLFSRCGGRCGKVCGEGPQRGGGEGSLGQDFVVLILGESTEAWGLGRLGGCCFEASGPYFVVWAPWWEGPCGSGA